MIVIEFLSTWEEIYNPDFKVFESEHFKKEAGLVTFTPSVTEWVEKTNAVGLYMIREGRDKEERFLTLKEIAEYQLRVLREAEQITNRIECE